MLNKVAIMGRITRDLELNTTASGLAVTSFSIACDRNYKEKGSNEYITDFYDIVAWRATAEFICKHFTKGSLIAIEGTLQTRTYTDKNNVNHKVVEIIVDSAFFCEKKKDDVNSNAGQNIPYGEPPREYTRNASGNVPQDNEFNNMANDFYPEFGSN